MAEAERLGPLGQGHTCRALAVGDLNVEITAPEVVREPAIKGERRGPG